MKPTMIRLAFDGGNTSGDPGDGRLRFSSPRLTNSTFICVNARDAQESLLDQFVPTWAIGDVLVVERPNAERNRVVVWIIGPISHRGPYYQVPIMVRSVNGNFAAHDELVLHHHKNVVDTDEPEQRAWVPPKPKELQQPQPTLAPPVAFSPEPPVALLAPMALTDQSPENRPLAPSLAPIAAGALTDPAAPATVSEIAQLRTDVGVLHDILAGLLSDTTELYVVETAT